jgi:hypothetical protein
LPLTTGGSDSGEKLRAWYDIAESQFPILADEVIILPDTKIGTFGLAWCYGLDPETGWPMFAVRDDIDVDLTPYIPFHEAGHAFQQTVAMAIAEQRGVHWTVVFDEIRDRYWKFRGFPGTWWDGQLKAINGGGWSYYPDESFADAFAHVMLYLHPIPWYVTGEWTWNYNTQPIWQRAEEAVAFMRQLAEEGDDMFSEDDRALLRRVKDLLEAEAPKVWTARSQRILDVETGLPYNPNNPPLDPRIKQV